MRIAVISDTHDHFPPGFPDRLAGADEIWHLGDVSNPQVLVEFEQLGKPLRIVLGNCDFHAAWPETLRLEPEGVPCLLVHIPPRKAPKDVQVLLHGHTHIPRDYTDAFGVRWLNPGSVSNPRGGFPASFGWLELAEGRLMGWSIERV